jgi:glycosyltransferase involved in cell wall biosynthesis
VLLRDAQVHDALAPRDVSAVAISVVVCVYNRADQLRQLLAALAAQDYPPDRFEVLVVDDGSVDNLQSVIDESLAIHRYFLTYLRQAHRGPGVARNLGLAHARGQIVAFTDSDCLPEPTWLSAVDQAFDNSDVHLVGGKVDFQRTEQFSGRCVNFLMSSLIGAAGARDPRSPVAMKYYPRTCNLAVRRILALDVGGFPDDERSYGEDLEFSHRIYDAGGRVDFVPAAIVHHNETRGYWDTFVRCFGRGQMRVRLAQSLGMHQPLHMLPSALVGYLVVLPLAVPLAVPEAGTYAWALLLPGLLYVAALAMLALQGAVALRSLTALIAVPAFAMLMHLGYGLGYGAGTASTLGRFVIPSSEGRERRRSRQSSSCLESAVHPHHLQSLKRPSYDPSS